MATVTKQELLDYLFADPSHVLAQSFDVWADQAAFRAFAHRYRDKIRKKLRGVRDPDGMADLNWELQVAFQLLQTRSFDLSYEHGGVGFLRGPDFVASFKGHTPIGMEATRMRASVRVGQAATDKLADILCAKLAQTIAQAPNLLVVRVPPATYLDIDGALAIKTLVQRAEHKDAAYFAQRGYTDAVVFLKSLRRLSGLLVATGAAASSTQAALWLNPLAQRPLPEQARKRVLQAFHDGCPL